MAPFAMLSCFVRRPRRLCSHVILKLFMPFAAFNQGAEFLFSKRQTAPACVKFSGEEGGGGGGGGGVYFRNFWVGMCR